jgi:lantibiotic biosynthesis protein
LPNKIRLEIGLQLTEVLCNGCNIPCNFKACRVLLKIKYRGVVYQAITGCYPFRVKFQAVPLEYNHSIRFAFQFPGCTKKVLPCLNLFVFLLYSLSFSLSFQQRCEMNWRPMYSTKDGAEMLVRLQEIRKALMTVDDGQPNLLGGAPGLALFHFYLARATGDESLAERGIYLISQASDTVEKGFNYPTFAGGLAGLGWTIAHLAKQGFIEADVAEILGDLTEPLRQSMMEYIGQGEYDYLHGALGIALYFLERNDLPETPAILQTLVKELDRKAQTDDKGGLKWECELDIKTKKRGFNLSLSHGQASIIDILGRMVAAGYGGEQARPILDGAVAYLLNHELPQNSRGTVIFPSQIIGNESMPGGRLGWCYGDLGAGQVLLRTGLRLGVKSWQEKGLAVLHYSMLRRDPREASINDAGLCHGSAGVAHIYNRLWQETGDEAFAETARFWFDFTLKLATFSDGLAGYKAWRTPEYGGWINETGLLEGVAGIGLAMISALYPLEPSWDRCLLLS